MHTPRGQRPRSGQHAIDDEPAAPVEQAGAHPWRQHVQHDGSGSFQDSIRDSWRSGRLVAFHGDGEPEAPPPASPEGLPDSAREGIGTPVRPSSAKGDERASKDNEAPACALPTVTPRCPGFASSMADARHAYGGTRNRPSKTPRRLHSTGGCSAATERTPPRARSGSFHPDAPGRAGAISRQLSPTGSDNSESFRHGARGERADANRLEKLHKEVNELRFKLRQREDKIAALMTQVQKLQKASKERPGFAEGKAQHSPSCEAPCCTAIKALDRAGLNVEILSDLDALWAGQVFGAVGMEVNNQGMTFWEIFKKHKTSAGKIDMVAFREFIRQIFPVILEDRLTRLFYFADVDGSGSLSFLEFLRIFAADLNGNMGSEYFEYVMARAHGAMIKRGGFTECLRRQNRKFGEGNMLGRKALVEVLVNLNIGLTHREATNLAAIFSRSDRNKVDTKAFCDAMAMCASQAFVTEEWVQDLFGQVVRTLHSRSDSLCEALQGATETGYLDRPRFEGFLRRVQPDIRDSQIERLFGYMSATTDRYWKDAELHQGQISLRHFFNVVCKPTLGATGPSKGASAGLLPSDVAERLTLKLVNICGTLDNSFNSLDPCLCVDEFQAALRNMGFAPDIDYKHLFNLLDVHRVGRISRSTFVQVLARHIPAENMVPATNQAPASILATVDQDAASSPHAKGVPEFQQQQNHLEEEDQESPLQPSSGMHKAGELDQRLQSLRKPAIEAGKDSAVPMTRHMQALNEHQQAVNRILTLEVEIDALRRQVSGTHDDYRLESIVRTLETANTGLAAKLKAFEAKDEQGVDEGMELAAALEVNVPAGPGAGGRPRRGSGSRRPSFAAEVDTEFQIRSMLQSELSKVRAMNRELQEEVHELHRRRRETAEQQQLREQEQQRQQHTQQQQEPAQLSGGASDPVHRRKSVTIDSVESRLTQQGPAEKSSHKLTRALAVYSFDSNIVRLLTQVTGLLVLSRFRIDGVQSVESDSVILSCEDLYVKRGVSIKIPTDQGSRESFMRECSIIAMLGDVAETQKVYHFPGPWEPLLYCIMEFLRGRLLSERLRATRHGHRPELASYEAAELCDAMLHGVEQCHRRGVLHLDLKPSVIWEMEQPAAVVVKILDFGLARLTNLSQVPEHSQQLFKDSEADPKEITEEGANVGDENDTVRQRRERPKLMVDRECQHDKRKVPSEDEHVSVWQEFAAHASFSGVGPAWYMSPARWSGFLLQQQQANAPRCDLRWHQASKGAGLFIEPGEPGCMDKVAVRSVPIEPQTVQAADPAFRSADGWYYEVVIGKVWPRCFISCRDVDKPNGPTGCALGFTRTRPTTDGHRFCRAWRVEKSLVVGYDGRVFFQGALAAVADESDPSALSRFRGRAPDAAEADEPASPKDSGAEQWPIGPLGWSFAELRRGDRVGMLAMDDCRLVIYVNGQEVTRLIFEDEDAQGWFDCVGPLYPLLEVCGCVREVGLDPQPMGPSKEAALSAVLRCCNTVESLGKHAAHMYADTYAAGLICQEIFLSSHVLQPPPTFALLVVAADRWLQQGARPLGSESTIGLLQLVTAWSRTSRVEESAPPGLAKILRCVFDRVSELDDRPIRSVEVLRAALNSLSSWSHVSPDFMKSHMLPQQPVESVSKVSAAMVHRERVRTTENTWDLTGWRISSSHIRRIIGVLGSQECEHIRYVKVSELEPNIAPELKRKLADCFTSSEEDSTDSEDSTRPQLLFKDVALPTDRCPVPLVQLLNGNSVGLVTRFIRCVNTNADPVGTAPIGVAGALALAEAMLDNSALHELCLARQQLGEMGAMALAQALPQGCLVTKLDLSSNDIGHKGVAALVDALLIPCIPVEHLDLTNNSIGDHGCKILAHMLLKNESLRHLILQRNRIGPQGAVALGGAMCSNLCLLELDLGRNKVGRVGVEMLIRAARTNCTIASLNLQDNELSHDAVHGLATVLSNENDFEPDSPSPRAAAPARVSWGAVSTSLRELNLRHNAIGSAGARSLLRCLRKIPNSIAVLNLSWNELGADAAKSIANLFAKGSHCMLEELDLRDNRLGGCAALGLAFHVLSAPAGATQRRSVFTATPLAAKAAAAPKAAVASAVASSIGVLRRWNVANCDLDPDNLRLLTLCMPEFAQLEVLLLYNNPRLGGRGPVCATAPSSEPCWEDAQRVRIALATAKPKRPSAEHAKGGPQSGPEAWIGDFAQSLTPKLQRLSFGSCALGNDLASELVRALMGRPCLQELDLSDNDLIDADTLEVCQRDSDGGEKIAELHSLDDKEYDEGESSEQQSLRASAAYDEEQQASACRPAERLVQAVDAMIRHPTCASTLMLRLGLNMLTDRFAVQVAGSLRRGVGCVDLSANKITVECKKAVAASVAAAPASPSEAGEAERSAPAHPASDVLRGLGARLLL